MHPRRLVWTRLPRRSRSVPETGPDGPCARRPSDMWDTLRPPSAEETAGFYGAGWWRPETFLDDLARNAAERPDHPAVIGYAGGTPDRTLTWAQYAASVTR